MLEKYLNPSCQDWNRLAKKMSGLLIWDVKSSKFPMIVFAVNMSQPFSNQEKPVTQKRQSML